MSNLDCNDDFMRKIVLLQSVSRGWLVRKRLHDTQKEYGELFALLQPAEAGSTQINFTHLFSRPTFTSTNTEVVHKQSHTAAHLVEVDMNEEAGGADEIRSCRLELTWLDEAIRSRKQYIRYLVGRQRNQEAAN